MSEEDILGFVVFNGILCWIFVTVFLAVVGGWPIANAIAGGFLVAFVASIFVAPAFLINVFAIMLLGLMLLLFIVGLIVP